ncbi:MAG: hypothetical protein GZ094_11610 [Mariniphaga sp.]|nr:hypothetical protein [Mariniphaga sp.]
MRKLSAVLFLLFLMVALNTKAQDPSVNEKLTEVNDKVNGLLERLATDEADLSKLTKIKVSGYMQAQYQNFESPSLLNTSQNYFSLRRVRVKFTYEALDGIKFVLTPDFSPGAFSLKDAYVVVNDHWSKSFALWAGKFNRPNYEVEYSSSQREMVERSLVIRTLYPGERAIGAKLEYSPLNVPIKMQVAVFNGGEGQLDIRDATGAALNANENKDYDNYKDVMARVTYNLSLGSFGGLDIGAHGYFGALKSNAIKTLSSDYTTVKAVKIGDAIGRNWLGGEFQLFADILGGLSIKGEYIAGKNVLNNNMGYDYIPAAGTTAAKLGKYNFVNKFAGYYLYFIKNLGKTNQIAFRYDYYDPNTEIKGTDVKVKAYTSADPTYANVTSGKADLATSTFGFVLHHYFDDNIRISASYEIVQNEKVGVNASGISNLMENYTQADGQKVTNGLDYSKVINQNVFTLRIQAKF